MFVVDAWCPTRTSRMLYKALLYIMIAGLVYRASLQVDRGVPCSLSIVVISGFSTLLDTHYARICMSIFSLQLLQVDHAYLIRILQVIFIYGMRVGPILGPGLIRWLWDLRCWWDFAQDRVLTFTVQHTSFRGDILAWGYMTHGPHLHSLYGTWVGMIYHFIMVAWDMFVHHPSCGHSYWHFMLYFDVIYHWSLRGMVHLSFLALCGSC